MKLPTNKIIKRTEQTNFEFYITALITSYFESNSSYTYWDATKKKDIRQNQWGYLKLGQLYKLKLALTPSFLTPPFQKFYFKHYEGISLIVIFIGNHDVSIEEPNPLRHIYTYIYGVEINFLDNHVRWQIFIEFKYHYNSLHL